MKYCPHCGAELEPGSKFCTKCGAKIEDDPSGRTPKGNDQPASWIKAEQGGKKARQDTMVFNQNPNARGQQRRQQSQPNVPPEPPEEENEKKQRTNSILTGVLIGLLVVAVAVGGFFIWRNRQQNQDTRQNQQTTQSSNSGSGVGSPNPGEANILEPSASVSESAERARRDGYRGLVNENGRTVYMNNGKVDSNFNGIVPDDRGTRYFVDSGQVRYSISDQLTDNNGQTYTLENGQVVEGSDETTTTNADDQGVDSTQYNETDNSNGAQKFDDYDLDNETYINSNPPEFVEGEVRYGVDSVSYDEAGNYVLTMVILNGTDKKIHVKEIDDIELRNGKGTIATGKVDDIEPIEIDPDDTALLSTTLVNESKADEDLSDVSIMANIVQE